MNSKHARAVCSTILSGLPEFHGRIAVPPPNGSANGFFIACQYATANRNWSFIVLPPTISVAS